jgi:hypothetical protein
MLYYIMSLDTLDRNIRDRIDRESRFIDDLKNGLQEIIRTMKACNKLVKTATPSQKKDIINQIQRATASLRNLSVLNSGTIVNPFRDYATRYIKNDDRDKGTARIFSETGRSEIPRERFAPTGPPPRWQQGYERQNQDSFRTQDELNEYEKGIRSQFDKPVRSGYFGGWKPKKRTYRKRR